jgi:hypothetical protein
MDPAPRPREVRGMSNLWQNFTNDQEALYQKICLELDLSRIQSAQDLPRSLMLHQDQSLHIVYAPFGLLPQKKARVVIVGLTPGFQQAWKAYENFQKAQGDLDVFAKLLIQNVVFAGSTRSCLIAFLDELGLAEALNLTSTAELFQTRTDLLMPFSLLRYPIFVGDALKNYGGTDSVHKRPIIQAMIHEIFYPYLMAQDPEALIIPMGKYPALALQALTTKDPMLVQRTLLGFPHTSGSNAHRWGQFAKGKAGFQAKIDAWAQSWKRR